MIVIDDVPRPHRRMSDRFEEVIPMVDVVLDMVGGDTRERSLKMVKPGGILGFRRFEAFTQPRCPDQNPCGFFLGRGYY